MAASAAVGETGWTRRKRATRRALRAATLELGLARNLHDVAIEDIAAQAGVSPRTFFNYFDAKDDAALIDLFTISDEELTSRISQGAADALWDDLVALFGDDVERAERPGSNGPDLPRYMELHRRHPALQVRQLGLFARFEQRLSDAIATRLGGHAEQSTVRRRADVMAGSCITAVRVGLHHWGQSDWQGSARRHVEAAFGEYDRPFRTTTGLSGT